jgi:acid phosphatase
LETAAKISKSFPGYCFYGQLTDTGKRNMMALGSRLRFFYIDQLRLLNPTLVPSSLYVRSTDYSRTIESVQYLLGGLYPRKNRHEKQDLQIHVRDYKDETMIPHTNCPSLLSDTLKRKNEIHDLVKEEAERAFDQVKHLGN